MSPTPAIKLPRPQIRGKVSVEEAISRRRSVRHFGDKALTVEELSQLLWATQGITDSTHGLRAAPSAGALYPLEVYVAVGNVTSLPPGLYHYLPVGHEIEKVADGDVRKKIAEGALGQESITEAPVDFVIAAVYERCAVKYGERASLYVPVEVGHAAENLLLQAVALDLGGLTIGAFYEEKIRKSLGINENEVPLYVLPVGRK